jgi:amino acid transporter/nucleotide-binding universal stress UspA family protein
MASMNDNISSELSRDLNLFHITMMGLGMMIGAGVFIGIGNAINYAGSGGVVLTFAFNGLVAMFTAMSYAELSSAIPRAGGAYNFARIGFGRGTAFCGGWMEWFASSIAGSLYAITLSIYTLRCLSQWDLLPWGPNEIPVIAERLMAAIVACIFILINYRGASETGKIGALFTLGQTLFLVAVGGVGIIVAIKDPSRFNNFDPFMPHGWEKLLVTMGFTYVAFEGFEVIAQAGDEVVDPRKNLPKAMLYSVFIVTLTYVSVSFAAIVAVKSGPDGLVALENGTRLAPWEWIGHYGPKGFGEAVSKLIPNSVISNLLLTLAVIFAATSALNATIYSATRASYALGRDRMLPSFFAKISPKRKTPYIALFLTGSLVILMATCLPVTQVASCASIMFLFLFFMVNVCAIKIRRNMKDELTYGYLMPLFPLFPIAGIICQALLAVHLLEVSLTAWIVAPLWVIIGLFIYLIYSKSRVIASTDEIHVLEEVQPPKSHHGYSIMVCVANPQTTHNLVSATYKICGARGARVELLHMVPVPDHVPLNDADKYMREGKKGIIEAMNKLSTLFPTGRTLRYCRNFSRGILSAVREKHSNMLILGWHGKPKSSMVTIGSTIDPIIERSPSTVVILKDCTDKAFKRVLVPIAGGPNGALALEIASIMLEKEKEGGKMIAFSVDEGQGAIDLKGFVEENQHRLFAPSEMISVKTVKHYNVVDAILEEAKNYDLIVMGCTRRPFLSRLKRAPFPETVARYCENKPLIMVNSPGYIRAWLNKWI